MAKKRRRIIMPDADVQMSAMIDVVFLLLIYFILTQEKIVEESYLSVNLPGAPSTPPVGSQPNLLTIDVMKLTGDSDNYYHVNNQRYHINDLREFLKSVGETDPNTTVIVRCGPNAKHKKLITLLDMCNNAGLTKINLVADDSVRFVPEA